MIQAAVGRPKSTFYVLEALRGLAAILVVTRHVSGVGTLRTQESYLAVDLFFLLSGFVLAYSYEAKLRGGRIAPRAFAWLRVARLYPLFCVFSLVGVVAALVDGIADRDLAIGAVLGLAFLPDLFGGAMLYPANHPGWSLFFELLASFAYGWIVARLANRWVVVAMLACWIGLAIGAWATGSAELGFDRATFAFGIVRVGFPFLLGVLVCRWWGDREPRARSAWATAAATVAVCAFALAILAAPVARLGLAAHAWLFDLGAITLAFPAVLLVAIRVAPTGIVAVIAKRLGQISYPLYVAHVPLFRLADGISVRVTGEPMHAHFARSGLVFIAVLVPLCLAIDRFIDAPLRARLRARVSA